MDADSFIVQTKKYYIYKDIAEGFETRLDTSERLLPKRNIKKIGLMKNELGGKIMKKKQKTQKVCHEKKT